MQNVEDFYAKSHRGNAFGPDHFGQDYNGWDEGEPIPARRSGRVSNSGYDAGYGHWVEIDADSGGFDFYAHMQDHNRHKIDEKVTENDSCIGSLGQTGSFATGPHVHTGQSEHKGGALAREVVDPLPKITAIIRRRTKVKFRELWKNGVGEYPSAKNTGDYVNRLVNGEISYEDIRIALRKTKRYADRKKKHLTSW